MPAYNGGTALTECLAAVCNCAGPEHEVLVVDDASTDDTARQAESCGVRVIRLPRNCGPAGARNEGARQARGDVFFFVDADVVLAADAVERVTRTLSDPAVAATFGSYDAHPRASGSSPNIATYSITSCIRRAAPGIHVLGGCGAVRRAAFAEVGGFDAARYGTPRSKTSSSAVGCRAGHRIVLDKQLAGNSPEAVDVALDGQHGSLAASDSLVALDLRAK